MFHTREEEARPVKMLITSLVSLQSNVPYGVIILQNSGKGKMNVQIRVCEHQLEDFPRVDHVPQHRGLPLRAQPLEVIVFLVMDSLGEYNQGTQRGKTSEASLDPKDDPPRSVGYDDASNKGANGRTNKGSAHEPAHCRCSFDGAVDISEKHCQ